MRRSSHTEVFTAGRLEAFVGMMPTITWQVVLALLQAKCCSRDVGLDQISLKKHSAAQQCVMNCCDIILLDCYQKKLIEKKIQPF